MPLGTLERSAPPFFKQGPSALSRLAVFSALALFLMVADARFQITGPFRQAVATVLYPVQWLMLQPVEFASHGRSYFQSLQTAQDDLDAARKKMTVMGQRANQADQLAMENQRLRKLLELRDRLQTPAQAAEVIYDTADPYTRRVVLDRGDILLPMKDYVTEPIELVIEKGYVTRISGGKCVSRGTPGIDGSPLTPVGGRNGVTRSEWKRNNIFRLHRRLGPCGQTPSLSYSVPMPALGHLKDHFGKLRQPIFPAGVPSCGGASG